jgi:hypothetical protein
MEGRRSLDTNQCGDLIHRKPDVVRRLARQGKIPFRKLNGQFLFFVDEIEQWIDRAPGKTLADIQNDS